MTRLKSLRGDRLAMLGAVTLTVGTLLLLGSVTGRLRSIVGQPSTHKVEASFETTAQLRKGDVVRVDGVNVGKIDDITLDAGGRSSTVVMEVEDDMGPLYRDAGAVLRWKTVLGAAFYIDLERGSSARSELGSRKIPLARTTYQVELDDIASVLQRGARKGLQTLPRELAKALEDPKAPAATLDALAEVSPAVAEGVGAVRGVVRDQDLRGLVKDASRTVRAIDRPRDELRALVAGAAATLETTGARSAELRSTLEQSPAVMRDTDVTLTRLSSTLSLADPLLARLRGPADDVAPAVRALRPAVVDADTLLRRSVPLLRSLRPAVNSLARAGRDALPIVDQLIPSLDRLDAKILPMLSEVDPATSKSTAVMIGGTFAGLASGAGGQMDSNGHFIRFPATAGNSPVYSLPCQLYLTNPDKESAVVCKTLQEALETYLSYQPFGPTPGTEPPPPGSRSRSKP